MSDQFSYLLQATDYWEVPHLIATVIMTAFSFLFYNSSGPRHHGMANPPRAGPLGVLMYGIFWMIITLPAMIVSYRCVLFVKPSMRVKLDDDGFQLGNHTL